MNGDPFVSASLSVCMARNVVWSQFKSLFDRACDDESRFLVQLRVHQQNNGWARSLIAQFIGGSVSFT